MKRPTDAEIDKLVCSIIDDPGPRWPGMTYEDGVRNALDWVLGVNEADPLDDS